MLKQDNQLNVTPQTSSQMHTVTISFFQAVWSIQSNSRYRWTLSKMFTSVHL